MGRELLPRGLKKAIEWLEAEPARPWRVGELAALCGVAPRTLQKHFHRFLDQAPLAFLRDLRFDCARRELLRGAHDTSITEIATRCGFVHLGRFAIQYRRRYGESPSETLRRSLRANATSTSQLPVLSSRLDRPAIAILPFENIGLQPNRTTAFADEMLPRSGACIGSTSLRRRMRAIDCMARCVKTRTEVSGSSYGCSMP